MRGQDPVAAFWKRVDKGAPGGCWIWQGARQKFGHGALCRNIDGKHRFILAHRYAWLLLRGPIPEGKHLCHTCDVPACVNPDHLYIGTDKTNADDKTRRGRWNGRVKLTHDQVRAIRIQFVRYNSKKSNMAELANRFGVSTGSIYAIVRGASWQHVR